MSSNKILVTTRSFRKVPGRHQQILEEAGYEIVNSPLDRPLEAEELAELMPGVVGAILGVDFVTAEVFEQAKELRVISRFGVGVDRVDLVSATAHGVVVTTTPGVNSAAVAELTLGLVLALARHISYFDRALRQENWTVTPGTELGGQTLGLIGMGKIGREVARRAAAFDMKILYHDPLVMPDEFILRVGAQSSSLEEVLSNSDVISLHLPLIESTRNLIDWEALRRMKPSALLINTARGGLVDEQALYEALKTGQLAGAAFDVFSKEPSVGNPLLELENFIATPHCGSATSQTTLRMGLMASENALAVLRGERPAAVANPEVYLQGDL